MKPLGWIGSSLEDVRAFPRHVQHEIGLALTVATVADPPLIAEHPQIPAALALQGFDGVRAYTFDPDRSRGLLQETLGFRPVSGASFEATEMRPSAPSAIKAKAIASSPESKRKSAGRARKTSMICDKLPEASLVATIFWQSRASFCVVCAEILEDVRPGTL